MPMPEAVLGTLLQKFVFDVDFLDLVMWSNLLTFDEMASTLAAICAWKWVVHSLDQAVSHHLRSLVVKVLLWLVTLLKPR